MKEQRFNKLENGDVEGIQIYASTEVTIPVNGEQVIIGTQPEYEVPQIILKDKLPILLDYLKKQKEMLESRVTAAKEVIEKTDYIDLDKINDAILKIPADKLNAKKLQHLQQLTQDFYMKKNAIENMKVLEENVVKIQEQIDFLSKLV